MAPKIISQATPRASLLPTELLTRTLGYLDMSDLWSAARVSRAWYDLSKAAGLHIHRVVSSGSLGKWSDIVDHALQSRISVAISVYFLEPNTGLRERLFQDIGRSLPILVWLSLNVDNDAYAQLWPQLQQPAPRLLGLDLGRQDRWSGVVLPQDLISGKPSGPITPPVNLFSGDAPVLRSLGIAWPALGPHAVPAFSVVTRFSTWDLSPHNTMPLAHHFPRLRHLMLYSDRVDPQVPSARFDLAGVDLTSLTLMVATPVGTPLIERFLVVPGVPVFHCVTINQTLLFWQSLLGWPGAGQDGIAVSIRNRPLGLPVCSIRVMAADGSWRRTYDLTMPASDYVHLFSVPGLSNRLEYLRLTYPVIGPFLDYPIYLPKLKLFRVDIDLDGAERPIALVTPTHPKVVCPALECVAVFFIGDDLKPLDDMLLELSDLAQLGRALQSTKRLLLILADNGSGGPYLTYTDTPSDQLDFDDIFFEIRRVPLSGLLFDHFDGDLWRDSAAVMAGTYLRQSLVLPA
ncbi:hypothetical protein AURDEDRAFT_131870 [Auricularia subglabra TFB-10046 SS5]|uniref:F-box domain-containing protein n=1 Tax=Auricularia subglabra (strain TFB-10046 / SS5) TaxID=717982 RepID=J0CS39_AURST|nr:hypothetical protein AURDEDRAFT_131870 [Auricularia subglabra TFB-10046 SS5]